MPSYHRCTPEKLRSSDKMQTRTAARRLAGEVATVMTPAKVMEPSEMSRSQLPSDGLEPAIESPAGAGSSTSLKRKREASKKKQTQPLKGGWVLPHGMGIGLSESDTTARHDEPLSATSAPLDHPIDPSNTTEGGASTNPLHSQPADIKKLPKRTRQTRISLQVIKVGATGEKDKQEKQETEIKLGPTEGSSWTAVNRENDGPNKRVRTRSSTSKALSDLAAPDKSALRVVQVKIEEEDTKTQLPAPNPPKLLVIKGIIIKDNVVSKGFEKIIVDASQLLDPNFRVMVKRGKDNPYGLTPGFSPYPYRRVPTPEACEEVHKILTDLHGEVKQPEKIPVASLEIAGCGEVPCVLDALLRTLISGNTLMALADAAIKNLAQHYGIRQDGVGAGSINWDKVRLSSHQELVQVIKVAGNGPKKSSHIKQILDKVYEENLERIKEQSTTTSNGDKAGNPTQDLLSLDYMHGMTKDEALAKFVSYPGIGIKTAACVTLFCLRMPCFAVDTHVHKFCRWLGWVPEKADPDNCFRHGDFIVPDHLKYGLHQLFIRHGQACFKCRKATKPGTKEWNKADDCPLEHLLDRSKAGSKDKQMKVKDEDTDSGAEEDSVTETDKDEEEGLE